MQPTISLQTLVNPPENEFNGVIHSLEKWGDCKIDSTHSLEYPIASSFDKNEIVIQSKIPLSKLELNKIKDFTIRNIATMEKILFNTSIEPIAYKIKNGFNSKWMATSTLTDSLKPLTLATLTQAITKQSDHRGFLITIGNELIQIYKPYLTPATILLILDKYADKDIPVTQTKTHEEITINGLVLMMNILESNLNINLSIISNVEYMYKSLKDKNLLLHVPTTFNEKYIKDISTKKLIKLFAAVNSNPTIPQKETTTTPDKTLTIHKTISTDKFAHLTTYIKPLSKLLSKDLSADETIEALVATELVVPDCEITLKMKDNIINLTPKDFKYAYIDEEELWLVLEDDVTLSTNEKNIVSEFLEEEQPTFEKVNLCYDYEQKLSDKIKGQVLLLEGA